MVVSSVPLRRQAERQVDNKLHEHSDKVRFLYGLHETVNTTGRGKLHAKVKLYIIILPQYV